MHSIFPGNRKSGYDRIKYEKACNGNHQIDGDCYFTFRESFDKKMNHIPHHQDRKEDGGEVVIDKGDSSTGESKDHPGQVLGQVTDC